ncbi:hypothetical protein [Photobacterium sp. TY1-4]|uniref:hypothetical protein n=1 Tax=Photobacterium sp. TY1-4 TaxID=2899122 RepID=UPI0021C1AF64|nr:hypothetical protein [Photobacterium sp. TY1-4]UXI03459.1 hypothetical protein NH461_23860 [Photobacterium sp. TY1-4]
MKDLILKCFAYTCYLPFQMMFSYVVGPILGAILLVGGLGVLMLILGYEDGVKAFRKEWRESAAFI